MREKLKEKYFKTKFGIIDTNFWCSDKFMYEVGQQYIILPEYDGRRLRIDEELELIDNGGKVGTITKLCDRYYILGKNNTNPQYDNLVIKFDDGTDTLVCSPAYYRLSWNLINKNKKKKLK